MLAITAFHDYEIWQMDVNTAFLNEKLTEDVFLAQLEGFEYADEDESCIYVKVSGSVVVFLVLYVDDILLIGNDIPSLQSVNDWLGKCFVMKDLGDSTYILGIKIYRDSKDLCPKTDEELDQMSRVLYASKVGLIMYAMTCTRLDVFFALSMFLVYGGEEELIVTGYHDASWQTDKDDSRSQSGWIFLLNQGAMTWKSLKQDTVEDFTCESEYIAACEASKKAIWIKNFIGDLGVVPTGIKPIIIQAECYGGGGETTPSIPGFMRLDMPMFLGTIRIVGFFPSPILGRVSMKILKERSRIYCNKEQWCNIKLESLVSKPTSLRDAFALSRVTEACLDDHRVSIVRQATTVASGGGLQRTQSSRISVAVCGHKWPGKFMTSEDEDTGPVIEAIQEDALEDGDILILNSLVGYGRPRSLQLWGVLALDIHRLPMNVDLYALPRKGPDIVLDIQWLQNLGKVTHDYSNQTMKFSWLGRDFTKHRMERQANRKRQDVEFNVGDMVLVKLQPYRQVTLAKRYSNKLAKRCYGPFKVLERLEKVAYRLALPDSSKIHPKGIPVQQVLVQWSERPPEEATWEWLLEFKIAYLSYHHEDKHEHIRKSPRVSTTQLTTSKDTTTRRFQRRKLQVGITGSSQVCRNFSVSSSIQPGTPPPPSGNPPMGKWILGIIITVILPFFTNRWTKLLQFEDKLETAVEESEQVIEQVEDIAEAIENVMEDVKDQLPEGQLRNAAEFVEDVAKVIAKDAHSAEKLLDKITLDLTKMVFNVEKFGWQRDF
uniref:Uncharacterized protein n=1 Tax=Tanacetum cinerariifolium TaxID=118510 RepID=A0A699GWT3_TANCI|nr:hypothetical protein [Tanacetum cinerariifolium]